MSHPGIRLRVSIPAGPILDMDSDRLNSACVLSGRPTILEWEGMRMEITPETLCEVDYDD